MEVLPRIFGTAHHEETAKKIKRLIDSLPRGSTVVLEMDYGHPAIREKYPFLTQGNVNYKESWTHRYFTELAKYATRKGHSIYWVERPFTFNALTKSKAELEFQREMMEKLRRLEAQGDENAISEFKKANLPKLQQSYSRHGRESIKSIGWRSEKMAQMIRRKKNWKETDVVIVGGLHANDLSGILGIPVSQRFETSHISPEIVALGTAAHYRAEAKLQRQRVWAKRIHKLLKPFKRMFARK